MMAGAAREHDIVNSGMHQVRLEPTPHSSSVSTTVYIRLAAANSLNVSMLRKKINKYCGYFSFCPVDYPDSLKLDPTFTYVLFLEHNAIVQDPARLTLIGNKGNTLTRHLEILVTEDAAHLAHIVYRSFLGVFAPGHQGLGYEQLVVYILHDYLNIGQYPTRTFLCYLLPLCTRSIAAMLSLLAYTLCPLWRRLITHQSTTSRMSSSVTDKAHHIRTSLIESQQCN